MESEKAIYWMTLGLLALASVTGIVTEHGAWGSRLVDRSIALMTQVSDTAADQAQTLSLVIGDEERDFAGAPHAVAEVQTRLACMQRTLAHRQAQMARLQAMRLRVRTLECAPRVINGSVRNIVIRVPQPPQTPEDTL